VGAALAAALLDQCGHIHFQLHHHIDIYIYIYTHKIN